MTKISLFTLATFVSFAAHAGTLSFESEQTLWACPPGAHHVVMECEVAATHEETIKFEMIALDEDFFQGSWESQREIPAYAQVIASKFTNQHTGTVLAMNISMGFSEHHAMNTGTYIEIKPEQPLVTYLLTGQRMVKDNTEFVPMLTISNLQYTE